MDIKGKITVVTGASQGIGLATAKRLAKDGAKLVLAARSTDAITQLAKELPDAIAVTADVRKPQDVKNLFAQALKKYGRIDVLINNAGQGMNGPLEAIDIDKYKDIMELNVYSVLRTMQLVIPIMRKQGGGLIINISSRVSKNYFPHLSAYASTKYALNALTLTARQELEKDNIIVSVFHPKLTATNFGKNSASSQPGGFRPGDRPGMEIDTPEQVADQIAEQIKTEEPERSM